MSADLQWLIVRNNSSSLLKGRKIPRSFSKEPNNLKNLNSFRYNGMVQQHVVGIDAASDGKGVTLVTRKSKNWRKPSKNMSRVELKRGSRRALATISKTICKNSYRKDLKMIALRRASALLRSQRPVPPKATRGGKKKE